MTYCVYENVFNPETGRMEERIIEGGLTYEAAQAMLPTYCDDSGPKIGMREEATGP